MQIQNDLVSVLKEAGLTDVNPDLSLANEALNLDIRTLDNITDTMLTKYIASLSQYNVYLHLTYSKYLILKRRAEKLLDVKIYKFCKDHSIKGTKKDQKIEACLKDKSIALLQAELDSVVEKLTLLEGLTKYVDSYVNALKKDLTRREVELGSR